MKLGFGNIIGSIAGIFPLIVGGLALFSIKDYPPGSYGWKMEAKNG